jgi:uncharacterized protein YutD
MVFFQSYAVYLYASVITVELNVFRLDTKFHEIYDTEKFVVTFIDIIQTYF